LTRTKLIIAALFALLLTDVLLERWVGLELNYSKLRVGFTLIAIVAVLIIRKFRGEGPA